MSKRIYTLSLAKSLGEVTQDIDSWWGYERDTCIGLLLVGDFLRISAKEIREFATRNYHRLGYLSLCGSGCEQAHDLCDAVFTQTRGDSQTEKLIMTTWHDEPLADALRFFLTATVPDESCGECDAWTVYLLD